LLENTRLVGSSEGDAKGTGRKGEERRSEKGSRKPYWTDDRMIISIKKGKGPQTNDSEGEVKALQVLKRGPQVPHFSPQGRASEFKQGRRTRGGGVPALDLERVFV